MDSLQLSQVNLNQLNIILILKNVGHAFVWY